MRQWAQLVQTDEATKHVRMVALTAHAKASDIEDALTAGCEGCITKPIDTRKVPQQVAGFFELSGMQPSQIGPQTILIVEDNPADSKLLRSLLRGSE